MLAIAAVLFYLPIGDSRQFSIGIDHNIGGAHFQSAGVISGELLLGVRNNASAAHSLSHRTGISSMTGYTSLLLLKRDGHSAGETAAEQGHAFESPRINSITTLSHDKLCRVDGEESF